MWPSSPVAATPVRRYDKILILPEIEHEIGKRRNDLHTKESIFERE